MKPTKREYLPFYDEVPPKKRVSRDPCAHNATWNDDNEYNYLQMVKKQTSKLLPYVCTKSRPNGYKKDSLIWTSIARIISGKSLSIKLPIGIESIWLLQTKLTSLLHSRSIRYLGKKGALEWSMPESLDEREWHKWCYTDNILDKDEMFPEVFPQEIMVLLELYFKSFNTMERYEPPLPNIEKIEMRIMYIVTQLPLQVVIRLIRLHSKWIKCNVITELQSLWILGLVSRIPIPAESITISTLRQLAIALVKPLKLMPTCFEKVISSTLIGIIVDVHKQKDLATISYNTPMNIDKSTR